MSTGLLMVKSLSTIQAEEQAEELRLEQERRQKVVFSSLAGHIKRGWEDAKTAKMQSIDERLLDCGRRQKGKYSPEKLKAIQEQGGSTFYPMITATKCSAGTALLSDILLPVDGRAWGLQPTPISDIPKPFLHLYAQRMAQEAAAKRKQIQPQPGDIQGQLGQSQIPSPDQPQAPGAPEQQPQGGPGAAMPGQQNGLHLSANAPAEPTVEDIEKARKEIQQKVQEKAEAAARAHEEVIADQLAEGGFYEAMQAFLIDLCTYPNAFMKGPYFQKVRDFGYGDGFEIVERDVIKPMFARVSPFDIYPSPDSTNMNDGSYIIERERYTRAGLNKLRGVPGYKDDALEAVLREYGRGGLRSWLSTDSERARLEDRQNDWLINSAGTIEGIHYWGSAQGLMLLQWGMSPEQIPDPLEEYEIDAILIGEHVVRCVINRNPMGTRPYHTASYQQVPGSLWGQAVPELMADIQDMCCALARAQANNFAFSSMPQVEIAVDRLDPSENPNEMYPGKRWLTRSDKNGTTNQRSAITFYQPPSMTAEYMGAYDKWESRADDATGIPRYTYGSAAASGAGRTASGLSMLLESANKRIKNVIRAVDNGVTRPMIESLWIHNMRYSDDDAIKGDCRVIPMGATAQLLRDQTQNARQAFLQTTGNPTDMQILGLEGRARLLRSVGESLDMPGLIPDDDALKLKLDQANESQAQQGQAQAQVMQAQQQLAETKLQMEGAKVHADTQQKLAAAEKTQAETQKLLLEIRAMMGQMAMAGLNVGQMQPNVQQQQVQGQYPEMPGVHGDGSVPVPVDAGGQLDENGVPLQQMPQGAPGEYPGVN